MTKVNFTLRHYRKSPSITFQKQCNLKIAHYSYVGLSMIMLMVRLFKAIVTQKIKTYLIIWLKTNFENRALLLR